MQKLVFKNANGIELDLTSDPLGITEWEGFSADELNIQSQQVPFHDGSVFLDALLGERTLSVTVAMNDGNDLEKRYRLRREMISKLNPKLGEGVLIYTNDYTSKQIHCIPQLPVFENHNSNDSGTPKANCSFQACNPYWEDLEDTVEEIESKTQVVELTNNGDVPCSFVIETEEGETRFAIESSNGKKIEINSNNGLPSLLINTNIGKKSVTGKGIFSTNGTAYTIDDNNYSVVEKIIEIGETYFSYSVNNTNYTAILVKSGNLLEWEKVGNDVSLNKEGTSDDGIQDIIYNSYNETLILLQAKTIRTSQDLGLTWATADNTENYITMCINEKTGETFFSKKQSCVYNPLTQEVAECDLISGDFIIHRSTGDITKNFGGAGNYKAFVDSKNNYIVFPTRSSDYNYYYLDVNGDTIKTTQGYGEYCLFETEKNFYGIYRVPFIQGHDVVVCIAKDFSTIEEVQTFPHHTQVSIVDGNPIVTELGNAIVFPTVLSDNYIFTLSEDSNMNFQLETGENTLTFISEGGCTISYRQKYIGV